MTSDSKAIVQKLWNYCNILRDDGLSYGDYVEQLTKRDKVNLDIFWLKDDALEDSANLPAPHVIAEEISQDLEAALEQFSEIAEDLKPEQPKSRQNEKA